MRYDEFLRRYKAAYGEWQLGAGDEREALPALSRMVPEIDEEDGQRTARFLIGRWEAEVSPAAQERVARALRRAAEAEVEEGTAEERIARLETAMRDVTAIARETDDEFEQHAILALNEPLASLADTWRPDTTH
ncbi:hypothetical protein AB0F43_06935 [Kribbella sp. NPDC023972]|uniref:hypothetical protein n=1 Tax=Kribbella sp. NPDC023972 TaxID=3154795 RepID=UPI0033ED6A55